MESYTELPSLVPSLPTELKDKSATTNLGNTQNFHVWTMGMNKPKVTIQSPDGYYTRGEMLGGGSFGIVSTLQLQPEPTPSTTIAGYAQVGETLYQTTLPLNNNYIIKEIYGGKTSNVELPKKQQQLLALPTNHDTSHTSETKSKRKFHHIHQEYIDEGNESLRLMGIEEKLKGAINKKIRNNHRNNNKEQPKLLEEAQQEAHFTTRYLKKPATAVYGQPFTSVTFHHQTYLATLSYMPAVAILMPKVPGITLLKFPQKYFNKDFTLQRLITVFQNITKEFKALHNENILHLDASPANLMIDPENNNQVQFVDFGTAQNILPNEKHPEEKNQVTSTMTREPYMYWRKERSTHDNKIIDVGVADDAFALARTLRYLISQYIRMTYANMDINSRLLAITLDNSLEEIASVIDNSPTTLTQPILLIDQLVNLFSLLDTLDSSQRFSELGPKQAEESYVETKKLWGSLQQVPGLEKLLKLKLHAILAKIKPQVFKYTDTKLQLTNENNLNLLAQHSTSSEMPPKDKISSTTYSGNCSNTGIFKYISKENDAGLGYTFIDILGDPEGDSFILS